MATSMRDRKHRKGLPYHYLSRIKSSREAKAFDFLSGAFVSFAMSLPVAGLVVLMGMTYGALTGSLLIAPGFFITGAMLGGLTFLGAVGMVALSAIAEPDRAYVGKSRPSFLHDSREALQEIRALITDGPLKGDAESLAAARSAAVLWDSLAATYASWVSTLSEAQLEDLHQALKASGKLVTTDGNEGANINPASLSPEDIKKQEEILLAIKPLEDQAALINEVLRSLTTAQINALEKANLVQQLSEEERFGGTFLPLPIVSIAPHSRLQSQLEEITDVNLAQSSAQKSLQSYIKELS